MSVAIRACERARGRGREREGGREGGREGEEGGLEEGREQIARLVDRIRGGLRQQKQIVTKGHETKMESPIFCLVKSKCGLGKFASD